jgi:phytoene dehydrogenase-like protein
MHGELAPDQTFFLRPIFGYADYRTPIDGLFMCGSGTHPGGGVMGVPGRNCTTVVTRAARRERRTAPLARFRGRPPT